MASEMMKSFFRSNSYPPLLISSAATHNALLEKRESHVHPALILAFAWYAKTSPKAAIFVACISRRLKFVAYDILYRKVVLRHPSAATAFAETVKRNPDSARLVRELRIHGAMHILNSLIALAKCTNVERISMHFEDPDKQCNLWATTKAMLNFIGMNERHSFNLPHPSHLHVVGKAAIELVPQAVQFNVKMGNQSCLKAITYICMQWIDNPFQNSSEARNIRGLVIEILRSKHLVGLQRLWLIVPVSLRNSKSFEIHQYFEDIDDSRFVCSTTHVGGEKENFSKASAMTFDRCLEEFRWRSIGVKHS